VTDAETAQRYRDLNPKYAEMARRRCQTTNLHLPMRHGRAE